MERYNECKDCEEEEKEYIQEPLSEKQEKRIKDLIVVLATKYPIAEKLKNMKINAYYFTQNIATDGIEILIQPSFLEQASDKNLNWSLMFVANIIDLGLLTFSKEINNSDRFKHNVAACYFINNMIAKYNDPDLEIIKGSVFDSEYSGKSITEIFDSIDLDNLKSVE